MDALEEAGLDLELGEMGRRLDILFSSRRPRMAQRHKAAFEVSAVEAGAGRLRVVLDADLPEAIGRTIVTLAIKHGSGPARGEGARKAAGVASIGTAQKG